MFLTHEGSSSSCQVTRQSGKCLCLGFVKKKNLHLKTKSNTFFHVFIIRMYKNRVQQQDGWNAEILEWCLMEAKARNLKEEDYWGGFVIDEMKIQVHY